MSWNSKVAWTEGLFLRPQHFQQADRYHENSLIARTGRITPYPWGVTTLEIDNDLAQQGKFGVRRASGVMPDGMPFDIPDMSPLPEPIELNERLANTVVGLAVPAIAKNSREVDFPESDSASRYWRQNAAVIDATAATASEEEIDIAHPRLSYVVMDGTKRGFTQIGLARVNEIQDKTIVFDNRYLPPAISTQAHPGFSGLVDRAKGWIEKRLSELSRFAADPSSGGGLQYSDFFILQSLNRSVPIIRHFENSKYVHPERLYETLISLAGDLMTYTTTERMAPTYKPYDHDNLADTFGPVMDDLQRALAGGSRNVFRLELEERAGNVYISRIRDRTLFQDCSFIVEVASARPLTEIQQQFPHLFKIGPSTKMREIVHAQLPGIEIEHLPTPPRQIRALTGHVYFRLNRSSRLWPEFSQDPAVGMHFSGNWPDLELEFWAVRES